MGHSDIGVTLNTYTHLGLEDATDELKRMEELESARKELEKNKEEKAVSQKMFGQFNMEGTTCALLRQGFFRLKVLWSDKKCNENIVAGQDAFCYNLWGYKKKFVEKIYG